jgi:glycerate dehydrogenase
MRIVVLDGFTLNPGDLSWKSIRNLGERAIYEHTPHEKLLNGLLVPKRFLPTKLSSAKIIMIRFLRKVC